MSLNLHNVVGDALTIVNDWQTLTFTKTSVSWSVNSRTPTKTTSSLVLKGKIQPANLQELRETGFNLQEYQYFKIYISGEPTQLDKLRQFGSDTFTCNNYTYKIVAKEAWEDAGWREAYAYRTEYTEQTESTDD